MGKRRVDGGRGRRADVVKSKRPVNAARSNGNKRFYLVLAGVAVVGIALVGWSIARPRPGLRVTDVKATPAQSQGYLYGNPNAPVHIIEFGDFECPMCGQFAVVTEPDIRKRILDAGLANLTFIDFPLDQHRNTLAASLAASCAADQGKFWPMHDRLFNGQPEWNGEATSNPKKAFQRYAREIGLDTKQWEQCYDSRKDLPRVLGNRAEAERRHIDQTPTFIIGTKMIPGSIPYDEFRAYVDQAAAQVAMQSAARADSQKKAGAKP